MRNPQRVLLLTAVFFALQPLQAQVKNPDTMVHRIFATLKAKDEKAFVALYPNAQQFGSFIRNMMLQMFKSPEMKKMMEQDEKSKNLNVDSLINAQAMAISSPETFAKMEKQFAGVFQKTIAKGEKKGVNWNDATITGYTIDSSAEQDDNPFGGGVNIKTMKGVIDFTSGGKPYQLAYNKVIFLPSEGAWFGAEFPQLARKGESLAPDAEAGQVDSVEMAAPKKKTTGSTKKAPAAKTKSNTTKSPARKPNTKS